MITRTIKTTTGTAMMVNVQTNEVHHVEFGYAGEFEKTDKKLINKIRDEYEDDTLKFVIVNDVTQHEQLYGMDDELFIAYAKVLPPRKEY